MAEVGGSPAGTVLTKADKARAYRLKLKETLDQAALDESRRKNRERQKRFRDKQKTLRQDNGMSAVLQAAAAAPGGFDAASALQHAHSLAAYGITDPTAIAPAIFASHAKLSFDCMASPGTSEAPPPAPCAAVAALEGLAEGSSADGLPVDRVQSAVVSMPRLPLNNDTPGSCSGGALALDEDTREALIVLSTRLAEGFCAEIGGLNAPARAAVLRGFLASVRKDVGDEVWRDVCVPAGGAARFLHISTIGNRLATTSEPVAPSSAAAGGMPLH